MLNLAIVTIKIDDLHLPIYDPKAFDRIVWDKEQRDILLAAVKTHIKRSSRGDSTVDVVQGKGRGILMLLHGPPGVGKTSVIGENH